MYYDKINVIEALHQLKNVETTLSLWAVRSQALGMIWPVNHSFLTSDLES